MKRKTDTVKIYKSGLAINKLRKYNKILYITRQFKQMSDSRIIFLLS